jgi:3-(3-hydroxy-phenyl)propionate hydroxylase
MTRVKALLAYGVKNGEKEPDFELEWASVYTFACQRMDKFVHNRVIFAGDAAHGVSPFGARGANSGIQDADNLGWKLDAVLRGQADQSLLQTYGSEREFAADENIKNSTRATDFITPKSDISRVFRDAVLDLAGNYPFARSLLNSGRLSVPTVVQHSELNTPDTDLFNAQVALGAAALDTPVLVFDAEVEMPPTIYPCTVLHVKSMLFDTHFKHTHLKLTHPILDYDGLIQKRYDMQPGTAYLLRPDQHICARWRVVSGDRVQSAINRALARE